MENKIKQGWSLYSSGRKQNFPLVLDMCAEIIFCSDDVSVVYQAHELRCAVFGSQEKIEDAILEADEMVRLEKNKPNPFFKRALLNLRMRKKSAAVEGLNKVLNFSENYFRETALLCRAYANLDFDNEASLRDAILLEDGFSSYVDDPDLGYVEISKFYVLEMAKRK